MDFEVSRREKASRTVSLGSLAISLSSCELKYSILYQMLFSCVVFIGQQNLY
jgi:hypothetical protein